MMSSESDTEHFLADWYLCKLCRQVFHSKIALYDHKRFHFFDSIETSSESTRRRRCEEWVVQTQQYMKNLFSSGFVEEDPLPSPKLKKVAEPDSDTSVRVLDANYNERTNGTGAIRSSNRVKAPSIQKQSRVKSVKSVNSPKAKQKRQVKRRSQEAVLQKSVPTRKSAVKSEKVRKVESQSSRSPSKKEFKSFPLNVEVEVRLKLEDYRLCSDCGKTFLTTLGYSAHLKECLQSNVRKLRNRRILTKVNPNGATSPKGHNRASRRGMCKTS